MKKNLFLVLLLLTTLGVLPLLAQSLGDVDTNGSIDIIDALLVAQYYVGLNPGQFNPDYADVDCSGGIDIIDALLISQYYVGLISTFPCDNTTATPTTTPTPTTAPTETPVVTPGPTSPPASVDFSMVGFATQNGGTTGGQGGPSVTVSTGTALQAAIKEGGPRIIYINGTITPGNSSGLSKIDLKEYADISIIGVGTSGEFNGIGIKLWKTSNIIIRNLRIHHVNIGDKDCISIEGPADHIWVDHCELYNDLDHDKDYYDGLLDAKKNSEYITYSWNYFHDSYKTCLVGSSDDDSSDRKITLHHNWFDNCYSRLPLYRFGKGHIYNCYYSNIIDTGINSRMGAVLRVENTVFENSKDPLGFWYSDETGYWDVSNLQYINCTGSQPTSSTGSFNPPYSYSLHSTNQVKSIVQQNVGVGKI